MASGTLTPTQAANHIPELWSADTIDAVEANVVLADQVERKWEKDLRMGDILHIGYISNPTAVSKTANSNINLEVIGPSSAEEQETITISVHQYVAFGVENITQVQSKTNLRSKYTTKAGYALASAVEVNLAALAASFSSTVGTLGIELTYDNLLAASNSLDEANAPTSDRFIVLSPKAKHGILKLDEFTNSDYTGPATAGRGVRQAYIGDILGAPTYNSTIITVPSAGQSQSWFCQKTGVALIMQDVKSRAQFSIHQDADILSFTQIYGYTEVLVPPVTAGGGAAVDTHNVLLKTVGAG